MSMTTGLLISIPTIMLMWYLALIGVMKEQAMTWRDLFRLIMKRFGCFCKSRNGKKEDAE